MVTSFCNCTPKKTTTRTRNCVPKQVHFRQHGCILRISPIPEERRAPHAHDDETEYGASTAAPRACSGGGGRDDAAPARPCARGVPLDRRAPSRSIPW